MSEFDLKTDDLILFFSDADGRPVNRWLPKAVYQHERLRRPNSLMDQVASGWKNAVLTETPTEGGGSWCLANLMHVRFPNSGPAAMPPEVGDEARTAVEKVLSDQRPAPGDLVIVPFTADAANQSGFLVTSEIYKSCPILPANLASDLTFMAVDEGVVFANVPKPEAVGISCGLLGLYNLKSSGATLSLDNNSAGADKTDVARAARKLLSRAP